MVKKIAFIGAQTGDEGKGVREAYYVQEAVQDYSGDVGVELHVWTMRWQGGANAGHTVERDGQKYALHQLPSGILIPRTYNLMGEGVFLEPRSCAKEIAALRNRGVRVDNTNFGIASNAHVTLDYHVLMDAADSAAREGHTSTGRGIKPTAVDKYGRRGIRFQEFLNRGAFVEALRQRFPDGMPSSGTYNDFVDSYASEIEALKDFSVLQSQALKGDNFKVGIGEGAQGFQLDVDRGLYPGVTSSSPTVVPFRADTVVGVVKMYESSVGGGRPFVGRMDPKIEAPLREAWEEFGTTTGKPRGIGWLDIVALRHAIDSCDIDYLVGTCGDRLEELAKRGEKVKLIVGYRIGNRVFREWDKSFHDRRTLNDAVPVYEEFEAWDKFFDKSNGQITPKAKRFVDRVEELTGVTFASHGYGPGINDVLVVGDILSK